MGDEEDRERKNRQTLSFVSDCHSSWSTLLIDREHSVLRYAVVLLIYKHMKQQHYNDRYTHTNIYKAKAGGGMGNADREQVKYFAKRTMTMMKRENYKKKRKSNVAVETGHEEQVKHLSQTIRIAKSDA